MFLVQPTCPPVNENLMELLIMIDSCKRASAERITAVMPYYGYARQDRKDEGRVPITAKLVANIITRAGADRVLAMDLHAAQIQGFFDVPVDHLYAAPVLNEYFLNMDIDPKDDWSSSAPTKAASSGPWAMPSGWAAAWRSSTSGAPTPRHTRQENIIGAPVEGKVALMFDDMISTAGSICGAAKMLHERGAKEIHVAATHGVLCGPAIERLQAVADPRGGHHRHDSAAARADACPRSRCSASPPCWARRSSASTATNRSAGCLSDGLRPIATSGTAAETAILRDSRLVCPGVADLQLAASCPAVWRCIRANFRQMARFALWQTWPLCDRSAASGQVRRWTMTGARPDRASTNR